MLTTMLLEGKLLRTLPCVIEPKKRNPATPIARHISKDTVVE